MKEKMQKRRRNIEGKMQKRRRNFEGKNAKAPEKYLKDKNTKAFPLLGGRW
ncbi:hypothetical protein [Butyrivibrio sp. AE3004]|uniref:hypothetical protein n=1 Tax=Butyrivibrio sp. AE3004 TaxID=1506994 RepID=UPI000B0CF94F|nr:hypothetical protein [Butyrivibrio sp. AE3004]